MQLRIEFQSVNTLTYFHEMRERLTQIHKNLRKQIKEQYFKQKRTEILVNRERQALKTVQSKQIKQVHIGKLGWRGIFIHNSHYMEQQPTQRHQSNKSDIDFDINLKSIQDGEYYLNVILQQVNIRCLSATIYLLSKLITKLLRPIRKLIYFEQKNQINLVYMILTHIHNLLQVKANRALIVNKNKKYILNLFGEDCKLLLGKNDAIITNQLISISYLMCDQFNISPNYHLVQHLLLKVTNKQGNEAAEQTIEHLIMKYLILCKIQQRSNLKQMNIPYQQIIYDFNSYIEHNLNNIYHFIKNNTHPFEYQFVNDNLSYVLTLQIQLINRFKSYAFTDRERQNEGEYLVKESIVHLLQKIILARQQSHFPSNELNQITIVLQETVTNMLWYFSDSKMQRNRRHMKRFCLQGSEGQQLYENESILSMIILIKVKLREIAPLYE